MHSGVYCIRNVFNGMEYIGSSIDIPRRIKEHRYLLSRCRHYNPRLQSDWIKFGEVGFVFDILVYCEPNDCVRKEQEWIDSIRPQYNMLDVVEGIDRGWKHSAATKALISRAKMGNRCCSGHKNALGYHHTPETKAKMSAARKGHVVSPESREKRRIAMTGRVFSPETRAKMSASGKKKRLSEEHKRKIGLAGLGRVVSRETRAKMRASMLKYIANLEADIASSLQ